MLPAAALASTADARSASEYCRPASIFVSLRDLTCVFRASLLFTDEDLFNFSESNFDSFGKRFLVTDVLVSSE